jgi:hypothetical protein
MKISNTNSNMPINCGMKGMHEGSKALQTDKDNGKNVEVKEIQKMSMEKHKGSHIDSRI